MQCQSCKDFFPLGFVTEEQRNRCIFCHNNTNVIHYKNGVVTREEIVKEYRYYLNEQREKNNKIRSAKFDPMIIKPK